MMMPPYCFTQIGNESSQSDELEPKIDHSIPLIFDDNINVDSHQHLNDHHLNYNNNGCFNYTKNDVQSSKKGDHEDDLFGFGNNNGSDNRESLLMGSSDQWDLEALMQDISSFPILDFSNLIE